VHILCQSTAAFLVAVFFVVILVTSQKWFLAHAALGLCIIGLVYFQVFLGTFTRLGMIKQDVQVFRWLKYLHRSTGHIIMTAAAIQIGLGIF